LLVLTVVGHSFDPFLRKAIQNFLRKLHPLFVGDETRDKEFWVAFYNVSAIQK
jgi:hypothetical protein